MFLQVWRYAGESRWCGHKKYNSDSCPTSISIIGYFSGMRHLTTLQPLHQLFQTPFTLLTQDFRIFGKTLFFERLEVKFAHAIQRNDLISVPLTLFGNCYFGSHKAFTVMSTWSGRRQNLLWLLNRCRSKQQKTLQELLLLSYRFTMTRVQNLINIIGGNMDVQVSFDFASAGIYAAQYEVAMVY